MNLPLLWTIDPLWLCTCSVSYTICGHYVKPDFVKNGATLEQKSLSLCSSYSSSPAYATYQNWFYELARQHLWLFCYDRRSSGGLCLLMSSMTCIPSPWIPPPLLILHMQVLWLPHRHQCHPEYKYSCKPAPTSPWKKLDQEILRGFHHQNSY